jgi:DNA processing protein
MTEISELNYWLWLTTRMGLSLSGQHWVLEQFGSPMAAYYADPKEYDRITALRPVAKGSLKEKSMEPVEKILADCDRLGVRITTLQDADYPQRLRYIYQPPLVLYQKGKNIRFDQEAAIAMAGTRHCSEYGRRMADKLAYEITKQGGLVVSGVVPGCDYASVSAALRAGGPVACVLAGGVDIPFDQYSHELYRRVEENGVLVSEYPPGREPAGRNFPQRNRILTGLCLGVVCVEGSENSGTMLVARNAMDQNRDVFAVPTGTDHPEGAGVLALIKDGAIPVTQGSEVLLQYRPRFLGQIKGDDRPLPRQELRNPLRKIHKKLPKTQAKSQPEEKLRVDKPANKDYIDLRDHQTEYTDDEQAVLLSLQSGPKSGQEVVDATGLPARRALSALTVLTLRGLLEEQTGKYHLIIGVTIDESTVSEEPKQDE